MTAKRDHSQQLGLGGTTLPSVVDSSLTSPAIQVFRCQDHLHNPIPGLHFQQLCPYPGMHLPSDREERLVQDYEVRWERWVVMGTQVELLDKSLRHRVYLNGMDALSQAWTTTKDTKRRAEEEREKVELTGIWSS